VKQARRGRYGLSRTGRPVLVACNFMIKRLLISVAGGGVLTWLTYLYSQIPSNGPSLITAIFLVPILLLSKAISRDNINTVSIVFFCLLVMFYSVIIFVAWWVIQGMLNGFKGPKK
jgi:hypothetical protein